MCKEPLNSKYCGTDDKEEGTEGKRYHLGREEGVIQDGQGHKGRRQREQVPKAGQGEEQGQSIWKPGPLLISAVSQ